LKIVGLIRLILHAKIRYKFFHFCKWPKKVEKKIEKHEKSIEKVEGLAFEK
jgi:hypothetical protein